MLLLVFYTTRLTYSHLCLNIIGNLCNSYVTAYCILCILSILQLSYCILCRKSSFMATYSYIVLPSNGPRLWPVSNGELINPPIMRRAPGRPKKKRNRANDEPTSSKVLPRLLTTVKCKKCGTLGHNSRTCKGKTAALIENYQKVVTRQGSKGRQRNHQLS